MCPKLSGSSVDSCSFVVAVKEPVHFLTPTLASLTRQKSLSTKQHQHYFCIF